jgi:hypothetical protein
MRYKIVEGSEHGCDHELKWSIVDTRKPYQRFTLEGGSRLSTERFHCVCECATREDADMILEFLNYS